MAVLKILVSAALLGTVAKCQDYYSAYSPGGGSSASSGQYARGTPRLVPVKVRPSASRFFPSYFFPGPPYPPPPPPPFHHHLQHSPSQMQTHSSMYPSHRHAAPPPTYPRTYHQLTGYYRPTRQSTFNNPRATSSYFSKSYHESAGQPLYHTAATAAPVVLKRGRVLPAPSPYSLEAGPATSSSGSYGGGLQYTQSIPTTFRSSAPQQQISASPAHHRQQHLLQLQQPQQPAYYIQKGPVVVGPSQPVKIAPRPKKGSRPLENADTEDQEEIYPSDPNPQYNFSFDIKDDELTNYQNRQEERDGQTIKGSYSVVDPDGYVRTVTYTADPKNGFQAKVTREPTDVKIKFPVPTEAPAAATEQLTSSRHAGPRLRSQAYQSPQAEYQPQYQAGAYATPQQVYASAVQPQVQVQPQYVARTASRFASSPRARLVRRVRKPSVPTTATLVEQRETDQE